MGGALSQVRRKNKYAPNLGHPFFEIEMDDKGNELNRTKTSS